MRNYHNRKPGSVLALAGAAVAAAAGSAVADDSMNVRPGSGYAVVSGPAADALPPSAVSKQEPMPVRPGFGYTIHFMTGAAAEALLPVPKP